MFTKTINTSLNSKFTTIFLLSFFFFAIDSLAQSEQEKVRVDIPSESAPLEDLDLVRGNVDANLKVSGSKTVIKPIGTKPITKKVTDEALVENKEIKKEESSSTLSFNLFLYIVDKFKAD